MDIKRTCPFGHECEKAHDGYLERCILYEEYPVDNLATGETTHERQCSINWAARMSYNVLGGVRSHAAATESFRNEMVEGQQEFNRVMISGKNGQKTNLLEK